jgi:hypothetical protein
VHGEVRLLTPAASTDRGQRGSADEPVAVVAMLGAQAAAAIELVALVALGSSAESVPDDRHLTLNLVPQATHPHAKCMDGTPPGYYYRPGTGDGSDSLIVFLEGGGEMMQTCLSRPSFCCPFASPALVHTLTGSVSLFFCCYSVRVVLPLRRAAAVRAIELTLHCELPHPC